jgi:mannose-6-phosphate isomerase-like protein (cupin superfamily)
MSKQKKHIRRSKYGKYFKAGSSEDIVKLALKNTYFRKVIYTGKEFQLVVMSIKPKEDIGLETHHGVRQVLTFVSGTGKAIVGNHKWKIVKGDTFVVPSDTRHNFINTGKSDLKLYTIYSPPEHKPGTIHKTKAEAAKEWD